MAIAQQVCKLVLLYILLSIPIGSFAKKVNNRISTFYFGLSPNIGDPYGLKFSTGAVLHKHHEIALSYNAYFRRSGYYPADYKPSSPHGVPYEWINGFALNYGYVFYPNLLPKNLRIILQGGFLIGWQNYPRDFVPVANAGPYDNYTYNYDAQSVAAFVVTPTVEVSLTKAFAVTINPYGIFSERMTGYGVSVGFRVGRMAPSSLKDALRQKRAAAKD